MYHIDIQLAADAAFIPKPSLLKKWAKTALEHAIHHAEITLRIVDENEMTELNSTYRHKQGPTNVLSFPFDAPEGIDLDVPMLGDIIICAAVVNREATEQAKEPAAHWAHMVVHGIFHLLGYDHETDEDAAIMEALEISVMYQLKFPNPYVMGEQQ